MIVHVLMHDPAVRRCRFFSVGHAAGISGHARPEYSIGGSVATQIALWLLVPTLIVTVGESGLSKRIGLDIRNDVSYGLYIYAFPIQQSISALLPGATWWESLLLATPLTASIAFLSWRHVEKPALKLKDRIKRLELRANASERGHYES